MKETGLKSENLNVQILIVSTQHLSPFAGARRVMDLMENQGDPQLVYALSVRVAFDDYRVSVV